MRRIILIITLTAWAIFPSCTSLMETSPSTDVVKEQILSNAEGLEVAMNGVYATMYNRLNFVTANAHQCFGNMAVTLAADLMGEDMVQTAQGAGWFWKDYNYDQRSRYTSKIWRCYFTWKYFYEIISNVNYIIAAADDADGDANELECILAQAHAARAFAYFMLIQSYQQTLVGHEDLPGVPIYTEPTDASSKGKKRSSVAEVYKQIDLDLETALSLFEECKVARKHISNLDFYSTSLLQARVALVENDWTKAAEAARRAISTPNASLLSRSDAVVTKGTFNNTTAAWTTGLTPFNDVTSSSVMWGAELISDQSTVFASFFSNMDACTNVYYAAEAPKCISNWLYAQIPETDIRKGWWNGNIGVPASDWKYGANINYNQFKFQWADQKSYKGDYIFMRLEEAYLILAEALCRKQDYSGAKNALGEVMSRRDTNWSAAVAGLTGSEQTFGSVGTVRTLMDEILLQRRIELWGETGRIFDILRLAKGWTRYWTVGEEVSNHTNYLSKYPEYLNFPADFIECIMMIPQVEIDNNPNINPEDQNPYVQN
ncbi:MAG: RagB/SusD family nutrient uptake outer membrane protein [Bacteroidales bacterium]|nr:RagB/SusD family nutrient uptake outer membrane protein [Candidatus Cryptobacteroides faecihippi]